MLPVTNKTSVELVETDGPPMTPRLNLCQLINQIYESKN